MTYKSKTWVKNWTKSEKKWVDIVKIIRGLKNGEEAILQNSEKRHMWVNSHIATRCGYCDEFLTRQSCFSCLLFDHEYCYSDYRFGDDTIFWKFVNEMKAEKPNYAHCLKLAKKMLKRIRKHVPAGAEVSA